NGVRDVAETDERDDAFVVTGDELQPCRCDDAERSLAAAQQRGKVVTRVVLDESPHVLDARACAEHCGDSDDLLACASVADDVEAARVRPDGPSDGRRLARTEI